MRVLRSGNWGGYPFPNTHAGAFAAKFAKAHGAKYGIALSNGTVAIEVSLRAIGIKAGDEVIVPAYTWEGTDGPILLLNAVPVRSEEHTSELQSLRHLVCRLLLEKKKN